MTDAREHLGSNPIPADSIDAVIAKQIPDWIRKASVEALRDLHLALRAEQAGAERVRELLKGLAGLVEFSAPKLEKQLQAEHNINVDVRKASLCTVVRKEYASMFPLPPLCALCVPLRCPCCLRPCITSPWMKCRPGPGFVAGSRPHLVQFYLSLSCSLPS
ncbi:DUF6543 domain-containing protein [Pseudomonas monteilii]|uniref:DUF6543 domain-containing protein n=1 Tax=Pseudomonas monteilii TaxID=76759 RepID=UPI001F421EA5|nr:DUF6543 domain-containing protein [Pseudomonas monteilii]